MSERRTPQSPSKTRETPAHARRGPVLDAPSQPISLPLEEVALAASSAEQNSPNTEESQVVDQNSGQPSASPPAQSFNPTSHIQHPMNPEESPVVDQIPARWSRILAFLHTRRSLLSTQGAIVASWRSYQGRRLGPYYRLAYREQGKQCSLYLGSAIDLVSLVRRELANFQRSLREAQVFHRMRSAARKALRASKDRLRQHLAAIGIRLKGFEFRGVRRALARGLRPLPAFAAASRSAIEPPPPFVPPVPPSLRTWFWRNQE